MSDQATAQHHLEWPAPGARVRGPVVWLRGWAVGSPGHDLVDLRVRHGDRVHLGLLGLPRTDLAAHFGSGRDWLPAEYVVGVPLPDGPAELAIEALDLTGHWFPLGQLSLLVSPDGETSPRIEGRLVESPEGTWTLRGTHLPFHGHLDLPKAAAPLHHGRAEIFGWLLHESMTIESVWSTTDSLVLNRLQHGQTDEVLAAKVPQLSAARHARLRGLVDAPEILRPPACLRVYARLADGTMHLCFAQRFSPAAVFAQEPASTRELRSPARLPLASLPSGRPRRLLIFLNSLQPGDGTDRALDLVTHLTRSGNWVVRAVAIEDGPRRTDCAALGLEVQFVDPQRLFDAPDAATTESELQSLGRQIWWSHLDAVAIFDPLCYWAIPLARRAGLPVLFDCTAGESLQSQPGASAAVAELTLRAWRAASAVCYGSRAAATAQAGLLGELPGEIIPQWHAQSSPPALPGAQQPFLVIAPLQPTAAHGAHDLLRAADWLARRQPDMAWRWRIELSRARGTPQEQPFLDDVALNRPGALAAGGGTGASVCLSTATVDAPVRALLDSAAAGIPVAAVTTAALTEIFRPDEVLLLPPHHPVAVAHALLDLASNPASTHRRAEAAARRVRTDHAPAPLIARWQALLEAVAAGNL